VIAALAFVLAAAAPACMLTPDALHRAQTAWRAFVNADFVNFAPEAEAHRLEAKAQLLRADRAAAECRGDATALPRAELHYEFDLVDARRSAGASAFLHLLSADLQHLRALGLSKDDPAQYESYRRRFAEMQAEQRGRLIVPPPAASNASGAASRSGCTQPLTPPVPLGSISPFVLDSTRLRRPHGTTTVAVLVSPSGSASSSVVVMSSGDGLLDQAVQDAARLVRYAPAQRDCIAVGGEYRFTYSFPQF
jgi:TonB family protein